jgi:peptidoglycan lytic transglycosylase
MKFEPRMATGLEAAFYTMAAAILVAASAASGAAADQPATVAEAGIASYYGADYHGKRTASGEIYDMRQLTAAHPRHAFGTRVRVTHSGSNRSVIVRINDRGPFIKGRVIDLSQAAAEELQMVKSGAAQVKVEIVE